MESQAELNIYVLECDSNKYYVGKTTQTIEQRFSQHIQPTNSCVFTSKFKPVKIIETIKSSDPLDEDKVTKRYMMKYGIPNVRGGSYTKLELEDWQIKSLEHEFIACSDLCYNCGKSGHFANACPNLIFNVDKYVEKFTNESNILSQINDLKQLLSQIILINSQIESTKQFNITNYKKLINFKQNNKTATQQDCCRRRQCEFCQMENEIHGAYEQHIRFKASTHNNCYDQFAVDIKMLELIYHNVNMQRHLKQLLNEFKTQEIITSIITKLYEKLIKMST